MATYTKHKLTDQQLQRLSAIVNGKPNQCGVALQALERKGLAVEKPNSNALYGKAATHTPTDAGIKALSQARKEGW